jgi:hypothetical protein
VLADVNEWLDSSVGEEYLHVIDRVYDQAWKRGSSVTEDDAVEDLHRMYTTQFKSGDYRPRPTSGLERGTAKHPISK